MIQEVRQALLLQRLKYGSEQVSHHSVLEMGTAGSATCLGRDDIGTIAPGKQADLALFKLDELRFSGAGDPLAALVLSGAVCADYVMVGGEWLVRDGELCGVDLEALRRKHSTSAKELQGINR
jgi:8-oxoguanine deaminase